MVTKIRAFLGLLALLSAPSIAAEPASITLTGRAMGTAWSAKFLQPAPPTAPLAAAAVTAQISARLEALETIFSTYRPTSELARFNTTVTTDWQPVSPELARVALASRELSALTAGAFDATVAPLIHLWGFGPQRRTGQPLPTSAEITAARARVDYRRLAVRLSPPALRKELPSLAADFSSLAKGFASDELSALLTSLGATHHLVQIGGDIKTSGAPAPATGWRTMIESPLTSSNSQPAALVLLHGEALSTSGDTHNFFTVADRRYGHVIDPRTGEPVNGPLDSVSVIAPTCAQSSSLATALFVLGAEAGYRFAIEHNIAALFLVRDHSNGALLHRPTPAFSHFATKAPSALPLTAPVAH